MAFDHNSLSKDLRPLNTARRVVEEPFVVPTSTATGRNIDGGILNQNVGSPSALSVYYPDSAYAGLGYRNQISGVGGCCQRVPVPVPILTARQAVANNMGIGLSCSNSPIFHHQGNGNSNDLVSDEGGDDSSRGKKVKLVCSFGGKILPRPGDGMLRYVGGHTRIISVRRDISFNDLVQKMTDTCGQLAVVKYQLPEEDLDALVSVSCSEDLENMMDEYEKLVERSPDGSAKLKVFLFSASDCDSLGMVLQDDSRDSRQKYVYAVNGIMDGVGVGIARKESIASAGSTQNSELSGTEGGDSLGPATEVNVMGLPASNMYIGGESVIMPQANNKLYPAGNSTSSHENTPKLACVDSNPLVYSDSYAMPVGTPIVKPGPLLTLLSQPDTEAERSVPLTMQHEQVRSDSRKYIAEIPPPVQYLQAYVTPHQQATNTGGYLQLPSQIGGFPSPQLMGTSSSVLSRCQVPENLVGVNADVPIPSGHVSMMPSPNIVLRPTFVQRQMQPSLARLDNNHDDMTYGPRFLQVPADHCCGTYQVQVPPSVVRGGYGWNQVPAPAHVMVSDGLASHQQLTFVDKFLRIGDCYMCQRALPHAHSDPLTQEQRLSNTNSVYHSLHTGDRGQQINRDMVNEVLGEGIVQGSGAQAKIFSQLDQQVLPPQFIPADFSQNIQGKLENEKMFLPQTDNLDYSGVSVPQEMMSLAAQASQGVNLNNTRTDEAYHSQQPVVPTPYLVKQDAFVSKPVYNEVPPFDGIAVKPMEHFVQESPKDNYADLVPRKVFLQPSMLSENLKGVDESMEALRISPLEDIFSVQHSRSNMPRNGDLLDHKPQHMRGRNVGVFLDEAFSNHGKVKESNQIKVTNALSCLNAEVPYLHYFHPMQSCGIAQQPNMIDPGSYLHSDTGAYLSNEVCNSNPASSVVHPFCTSNLVPSVSERKDDAPKFLPKMFSDGLETVNSNASCIIPPPASASDGSGEVEYSSNSTFNNRDPWDMQRDIHFVPLCKAGAITEARGVKDQFKENCNREVNKERRVETEMLQPLGTTDKDFNFALDYSGKDSDEELIKHELQTIAEDVAATVLHSTTSNPDYAHELSESYSKKNQERTAQRIDVEVHNSPQLEDIKSKMPEKINLGFPVSDGLGRLQIIKNSDLEELRELGSGTFGTVYHGKWRGTDVAIKRINDRCFAGKPSEQERMREDFWNEAINLADLHHPNVVAFYGVVLDGPGGSVATVTEFMVNGSLRNALQKNERNLDKRKKLLIAMDVAFGMEYLHGKNIVHFDLKSDNLLVNLRDSHRPICKVGDLGLSKVKCHTLISGGVRGTLPWMAPELLNGSSNLVSEKVDVFSFGIVLWEILTGEEPYKDLHYGAIIGGIVSNTLRPTVPESCDPEWKLLMERCWSAEPLERPSFEEIGNQLRTMSSKIPVRGQGQQQN